MSETQTPECKDNVLAELAIAGSALNHIIIKAGGADVSRQTLASPLGQGGRVIRPIRGWWGRPCQVPIRVLRSEVLLLNMSGQSQLMTQLT